MSKTKLSKLLRKSGYKFSDIVFPLGSSVPIFYIVRYWKKTIIACDYFKYFEIDSGTLFEDKITLGSFFEQIDYKEYLRLYNIS